MDRQQSLDVLTTISNLSNDEVFSPPALAMKMLDILPEKVWTNPNHKFLDPATKTGIFLREITKRLMVGLKDSIQDSEKRLDHILNNMVYGIGITEFTALMSRRTLYTTKAKERNIKHNNINHSWKNGVCIHCRAQEGKWSRSEDEEAHAYEFIHRDINEIFPNMKFDVIIGNPPYQMTVANSSDRPIYQLFINMAISIRPKYISFIVPSRWMTGGKGLDSFRENMIKSKNFVELHDFINEKECFPDVDINGGVNYFLWDKDHSDECLIKTYSNGGVHESKRYLSHKQLTFFVRHAQQISILNKLGSFFDKMDEIITGQTPFNFTTTFDNFCRKSDTSVKIHTSKGDFEVEENLITRNNHFVDKWKVYVSKANGAATNNGDIISVPFIGHPRSCCNQTYLAVGPFASREEAENCCAYMKTKFVRHLISIKKKTQNANRNVYELVPSQDFSKLWTDEILYDKYKLSQEEIDYIEDSVKEML